MQLLPLGITAFILFGLGIPSLYAGVLYYYRVEIRADQQLRAEAKGFNRQTNPQYSVRQRWVLRQLGMPVSGGHHGHVPAHAPGRSCEWSRSRSHPCLCVHVCVGMLFVQVPKVVQHLQTRVHVVASGVAVR